MDKSLLEKLENKALRLLAVRPRSVKEIRDRLSFYLAFVRARSNCSIPEPSSLIEAVIAKLLKAQLLDDREFAAWWVKERQVLKPVGKKILELELKKKGIDRETIEYTLARAIRPEEEEAAIRRLLVKKIPLTSGPLLARKKKCLQMLLRRGFDYQQSRLLVDQMLAVK